MNKVRRLLQYKMDITAAIVNQDKEFEGIREVYLLAQIQDLFEFIKEQLDIKAMKQWD